MVCSIRLPKSVLARCLSRALIGDATSPGYRNKIGFSLQLLLQVKLGHWTAESRGCPWDLLSKAGLRGSGTERRGLSPTGNSAEVSSWVRSE